VITLGRDCYSLTSNAFSRLVPSFSEDFYSFYYDCLFHNYDLTWSFKRARISLISFFISLISFKHSSIRSMASALLSFIPYEGSISVIFVVFLSDECSPVNLYCIIFLASSTTSDIILGAKLEVPSCFCSQNSCWSKHCFCSCYCSRYCSQYYYIFRNCNC
jgi:hypothetical protein